MNWLPILIATPLLLGLQFVGLDEALEAARDKERLRGRVSAAIAQQAVRAMAESADAELPPLVAIARAGDATDAATQALLRRYLERPHALPLDLLLGLPPETVRAAAERLGTWSRAYAQALDERDAPPSREELRLFVRAAPPLLVAERLRALAAGESHRELDALLAVTGESPDTEGMVAALAALEAPAAEQGVRGALVALVARDAGLVSTILTRLETATFTARARLLAALAGASGRSLAPAAAHLAHEIVTAVGGSKAAAISAYAQLEARPSTATFNAVLQSARAGLPEEQAAALAALPALLHEYRSGLAGDVPAIRAVNQEVAGVVTAALRSDASGVLVAALQSARTLRLFSEAAPFLLDLLERADPGVRQAAVALIPDSLSPSAELVDRLLEEQKDPDSGEAAWSALTRVAGVRLPRSRPDLWAHWRATATFEEE